MVKVDDPVVPDRISPQDLENKFKALQGDIQGRVDDKKASIATVAGGAAVVMLLIFFLLGRRSGRRRSAVVEIRRVDVADSLRTSTAVHRPQLRVAPRCHQLEPLDSTGCHACGRPRGLPASQGDPPRSGHGQPVLAGRRRHAGDARGRQVGAAEDAGASRT